MSGKVNLMLATGTAILGAAFSFSNFLNEHPDVEGCLVDADDKTYFVYKDGKVEREPMNITEDRDECIELGRGGTNFKRLYLEDTSAELPDDYTVSPEFKESASLEEKPAAPSDIKFKFINTDPVTTPAPNTPKLGQ